MRADDYLAELGLLPFADLETIVGAGGLVVVAPHPDDESLGCGGLIAGACRLGRSVRVVVVSDGCGSHTHSRLYPPDRLRELREDETRRAVGALGLDPEHVRFLRLPDAHVPSEGPIAEAAAGAIVEAVRDCAASAVFVTWQHDPHCDHTAAAKIVTIARCQVAGLRVFAYTVWGWTLPSETEVGPPPTGWRLDIAEDQEAKRRAVAAHASQTTDLISDDPSGFRLEAGMIEALCGPFEAFAELPA